MSEALDSPMGRRARRSEPATSTDSPAQAHAATPGGYTSTRARRNDTSPASQSLSLEKSSPVASHLPPPSSSVVEAGTSDVAPTQRRDKTEADELVPSGARGARGADKPLSTPPGRSVSLPEVRPASTPTYSAGGTAVRGRGGRTPARGGRMKRSTDAAPATLADAHSPPPATSSTRADSDRGNERGAAAAVTSTLDEVETPSVPPALLPENEEDYDGPATELSAYELARRPIPKVETSRTMRFADLNEPLMCPVCLRILRETSTTIYCLHRFCRSCIVKSLRIGLKECPSCRMPCRSKRDLRRDHNMDALIAEFYPDLDAFDEHESNVIAELNSSVNHRALMESVVVGLERQARAKSQRISNKKRLADGTEVWDDADEARGGAGAQDGQMKEFATQPRKRPTATAAMRRRFEASRAGRSVAAKRKREVEEDDTDQQRAKRVALNRERYLRRKEEEDSLARSRQKMVPKDPMVPNQKVTYLLVKHPFELNRPTLRKCELTSIANVSVNVLCKFLAKKLPGVGYRSYKLSVENCGRSETLNREIPLHQIYNEHWNSTNQMVLYYSLVRTEI